MNIIYVSGPRGSGVTSALTAIVSFENVYLGLSPDDIFGISDNKKVDFSSSCIALDLGPYNQDFFLDHYKSFIEAAEQSGVTHLYVGYNIHK